MLGLIGIIALLTVLGLSLAITRLATIALTMTGLSRDSASFQARSAFTGTGFTTGESEKIVNHPVRRKIIVLLMIVRSAGLVTVIISIILSFVGVAPEGERLIRLLWLIGGVGVLLTMAHLPLFSRAMERLIAWSLDRWTELDVRDYVGLLKLSGDYAVNEMQVEDADWVEGRELRDCDLGDEGVTVLGIQRMDGDYVGAPRGSTVIHADDTLILYGRSDVIRELDQRRRGGSGDAAHEKSVDDHGRRLQEQDEQERKHERRREAGDHDRQDSGKR